MNNSEKRLLILAARESATEQDLGRMNDLLGACRNPARFAVVSMRHKVDTVVLQTLQLLDASRNPSFHAEVTGILTRRYLKTLGPLNQEVNELTELTRRLMQDRGIDFAFMRGVPFARAYYRNPSRRISHDADILIREKDRRRVAAALEEAGFCRRPCAMASSRTGDEYLGQIEYCRADFRPTVDVNWWLTGNAGIGAVQADVKQIWDRAVHCQGSEWRLSVEDLIINHIRHIGQGHDFEVGLLQACLDMANILRCESDIDWKRVTEELVRCECSRLTCFFAYFYDRHYRDASMPALMPRLDGLMKHYSLLECGLFSRLAMFRRFTPFTRKDIVCEIFNGNISILTKFWQVDRLGRLMRLLANVPFPSFHNLVSITRDYENDSVIQRRAFYYYGILAPCLPGLLLGVTARLLSGACLGVNSVFSGFRAA